MRRLAAVVSSLALLAGCTSSGTPNDPSQPVEEARNGLLRRLPSGSNLLFVSVGGEGSGQVTATGVALNWLRDDTFEKSDVTGAYWAYVPTGTTVQLSATPADRSRFSGWFGTCSGTGTCQVKLGDNVDVGAVFESLDGADPTRAQLTVGITGHGVGTVTGPGITCATGSRTGCSATVDVTRPPQTVTLQAQPDAASLFRGWSGSCGGTGDCVVTMDTARSAYANFAPKVLTVTVQVYGGGTVNGPGGFTCSSTSGCNLPVANTTPAQSLVFTATPSGTFFGWSAQCSGWAPSLHPHRGRRQERSRNVGGDAEPRGDAGLRRRPGLRGWRTPITAATSR